MTRAPNSMSEPTEIMTMEQVAEGLRVKLRSVERLRKKHPEFFFKVGKFPRSTPELFNALVRRLQCPSNSQDTKTLPTGAVVAPSVGSASTEARKLLTETQPKRSKSNGARSSSNVVSMAPGRRRASRTMLAIDMPAMIANWLSNVAAIAD